MLIPDKSGFSIKSIYELGYMISQQLDYKPNGCLEKAIEKAGGSIWYREPWDFERDINKSVVIEKTKKFTIYMSVYSSVNKDRFRVAHCLGHYILHYRMPDKTGTMTFNRIGEGRLEWEANWFAAGFLMPRLTFSRIFEALNGDLESISEYFNVNHAAVECRAKFLNFIKHEIG
jgi:Zn-dependent peptidase ImmA (M78 family)